MQLFFGNNLKFLREQENWKLSEIPDNVGFSSSQWNNWELGISYPKFLDLLEISKYFEVSEQDLIHSDLSKVKETNKPDVQNYTANDKVNVKESTKVNSDFDTYLPVLNEPETPYKSGKNAPVQYEVKEIIRPVMVTVDHMGRENVVLVPVKARAGYLLGYGDPEFIASLPAYRLPGLNNGTFRMFEVTGLSMYQTLNSSDVVIGEYVEQPRFVKDDRVYVFVTKDDGILIKRALNRVDQDGKFILKSDNIEDRGLYPNIVLNVDQVAEIWEVKYVISKYLRSPASIYNRISELEAKYSILEDKFKQLGGQQ